MSKNRIILVTAGIMLSLFLASMESTVVATAMPTIVGQLGGLEHYSWVFSAFTLASTTAVPLYGKLSDIYGRRNLYVSAMALFLIGSVWCGLANSMTSLIFARALQGIGAGGIMPLAFILIGEMFTLEQRARMQGLFSGVWGVSSIGFRGAGSSISTFPPACSRRLWSRLPGGTIMPTGRNDPPWIMRARPY